MLVELHGKFGSILSIDKRELMKVVLLTWATWFVWGFLLEALLKEYTVIVLKRTFSNTQYISTFLDFPNCITYNIDQVPTNEIYAKHKIDVVVHTATKYWRKYWEKISDIVQSTLMFPLELLENSIYYWVPCFINTDSFFNGGIWLDELLWYHAFSKEQFLRFAKKMIDWKHIKFINLKIGHIYWPRDDENKFVPTIINKMLLKEAKIDLTLGEQQRNFLYVKDLVDIYITILKNLHWIDVLYKDFYGWTWEIVTIKQIVQKIKSYTHSSSFLNFWAIQYRKNEIMTIESKEKELNTFWWKPKYSIDEWLKETIAYFKSIMW
jgi:nucleoside-diphosphate-sugar epimerase